MPATTVTVTATFNYVMEVTPAWYAATLPAPFSLPMPFVPDATFPFSDWTKGYMHGVGATEGTLSTVGQIVQTSVNGAQPWLTFATVDVPSLVAAVGAAAGASASLAGPVTFTTTAADYTRWAMNRGGFALIPITWSAPGIGAYMVAAQEDWTLQPSFATDATQPPDIRTTTTITATAVPSSGPTATVTYPIRYPPLATFAPASYPLIASVPVPSGLVATLAPHAFTPPVVLTGTLTGAALTGPFLLAFMDTNTGTETWTFPSAEDGFITYRLTAPVLTVPVTLRTGGGPPLWQRQRIGAVDSPEGFAAGLVTPQSSPWQGGTL